MSGANVFRIGYSFSLSGGGPYGTNEVVNVGSIGAGWIVTRVKASFRIVTRKETFQLPAASAPLDDPTYIPALCGVAMVNTGITPSPPTEGNLVSVAWLVSGHAWHSSVLVAPGTTWSQDGREQRWEADEFLARSGNPAQQDVFVAWNYAPTGGSAAIPAGLSADVTIWYG